VDKADGDSTGRLLAALHSAVQEVCHEEAMQPEVLHAKVLQIQ